MDQNYPQLYKSAEANNDDGCAIGNAMANIPVLEHLQAIRALQQHLDKDSLLDIQVNPASTALQFEYSIYSGGPSQATMQKLADELGMSKAQAEQFSQNIRTAHNQKPTLLLHESLDLRGSVSDNTLRFKVGFNGECHSP